MRARTPTPSLQAHVGSLWDARLAHTPYPEEPPQARAAETVDLTAEMVDDAWPPADPHPFDQAGRIALELHGLLEMPAHGARQSRAVLEAMAAAAMRKAE